MRASGSECEIRAGPFDAVRRRQRAAVPDRESRATEHPADLRLVEAREPRRAQREQELVRQPAVRIVGCEQDLLRRHLPHQVEEVDDAPQGGVEEHPGHVREVAREAAEVGDARMGDDQANVGVAVDERGEMVADRRQPAAAVDQDRDVALDREREDRVEPLVADRELLGPRVQLDPARAEVEAAGRFLDGASSRSSRTNGTIRSGAARA